MLKTFTGVPKNKPHDKPYKWYAEFIHVPEEDEYMAKILIYDDYASDGFQPAVRNRVYLYRKHGTKHIGAPEYKSISAYREFNKGGAFRIINVFRKVYSVRYGCNAYICRIIPPKERVNLIQYLDNNNAEKQEEEIIENKKKDKIKLSIDEDLQGYIEREVAAVKAQAILEGDPLKKKDIDKITTDAFQSFFRNGLHEKEKNHEKSSETEKINSVSANDTSSVYKNKEINKLKEKIKKLEKEDKKWIKIKRHDGTLEDHSRVILELRRILKKEMLAAVQDGNRWNNAKHRLEKRV